MMKQEHVIAELDPTNVIIVNNSDSNDPMRESYKMSTMKVSAITAQ